MRTVHYLCRLPGTYGKLVYPLETDENYQSVGSFFLSGQVTGDIDEAYEFLAYRAGAIIGLELTRTTGAAYVANVQGIGQFAFDARQVGVPAKYAGRYALPDEGNLVRQLVPRSKIELEAAALQHDFIFLGYSPRLDDDGSRSPIEPPDPQISVALSTPEALKEEDIDIGIATAGKGWVEKNQTAKIYLTNRDG